MLDCTKEETLEYLDVIQNFLKDENLNQVYEMVFKEADEDENGEICFKEFYTHYLASTHVFKLPEPTEEFYQNKFKEFDTDQSGKLNKEEYKLYVRHMLELALTNFQKHLETLQSQQN
jgi:Ca2+-binding EF-hand superfamily protein